MNKTYFISRHAGAIEWIGHQPNIKVDEVIAHLDPSIINAGDTVIGTLPLHLASEVCERGAEFYFLQLPAGSVGTGQELTADEMTALGASIARFAIKKRPNISLADKEVKVISIHTAVLSWVEKHLNTKVSDVMAKLDLAQINAGDVVVGTLPIHLAYAICERGAEFIFLALNPASVAQRGKDFSLAEMEKMGVSVTQFSIQKIEL